MFTVTRNISYVMFENSAEENIGTEEGESDRMLEKALYRGAA
jgi:hypothetical protein